MANVSWKHFTKTITNQTIGSTISWQVVKLRFQAALSGD
jgi:hypothetical protein